MYKLFLNTLTTSEHEDEPLNHEFEAILNWASAYKMVINISKNKEMIEIKFRRPNPKMDLPSSFPPSNRAN
jgi:sulfur transfer protein SufE